MISLALVKPSHSAYRELFYTAPTLGNSISGTACVPGKLVIH